MKKIICVGFTMILCMGLLSGCSKKTDVDTSTVFIEKKGKITSVDVEALDKDYYDEAELESYITDHVNDYTSENGNTVEMASFTVTDQVAKLQMQYDSYEDYTAFNGIELYDGTVVEAEAAGYDFDTDFISASDEDTKKVSKDDVLADDNNKVVIIKANVDVKVDGTILYVSKENTKVTEKNKVSITGEGSAEEAALTYIIYK
ncbi:MAG: hypothetical protein V8S28_04450 [Lachnospiraceae bacterium]